MKFIILHFLVLYIFGFIVAIVLTNRINSLEKQNQVLGSQLDKVLDIQAETTTIDKNQNNSITTIIKILSK